MALKTLKYCSQEANKARQNSVERALSSASKMDSIAPRKQPILAE
jgi:hypothetical protein